MSGFVAVWLRNFLYFKKTILVSFFWTVIEPVLLLFAIGFSLGRAIGSFEGIRYDEFYVPALLSTTTMTVAYFESTFGAFTKLNYQKTFATIFLAPVSAAQIGMGEIVWSATKAAFGFLCVALVAATFGSLATNNLVLVFLILYITGILFSAFGLLVSTIVKTYDEFTYTISGLIIPMSLFSGTYFPLTDMPSWLQKTAYLLPLTHCVSLVRGLMLNRQPEHLLLHILYLIVVASALSWFAIKRVEQKLTA